MLSKKDVTFKGTIINYSTSGTNEHPYIPCIITFGFDQGKTVLGQSHILFFLGLPQYPKYGMAQCQQGCTRMRLIFTTIWCFSRILQGQLLLYERNVGHIEITQKRKKKHWKKWGHHSVPISKLVKKHQRFFPFPIVKLTGGRKLNPRICIMYRFN